MVAQALDPGLDGAHPGIPQQADLLSREVGLDLVEQLEPDTTRLEWGQQLPEVAHRNDVVDRCDLVDAVALRQLQDLPQGPVGTLGAVSHRETVQAAEGAMMFLPPPA